MPDLVEMAGGSNLFGASGVHSPWLDWDALVASDPDLFLIIPCGFGIPKTREELGPLLQHPQWPQLRAVQQNRVYLADGNQYFNRPGPRLTTSLEILAEIFHPDHFKYGHAGRGFELL